MKQDRFHASDYTPSEVEAAKRVMIEVAQNLGEYADACVVVGGWVPLCKELSRWTNRIGETASSHAPA